MRGYLDGADTTEVRRRIVVDYLNSTPLSARPGFGEVIGLGDGLWAWFGTDFNTAQSCLAAAELGVAGDPCAATGAIRRQPRIRDVAAHQCSIAGNRAALSPPARRSRS
ncbi:MAG: transglycosylase domain-containing protein, partial [Rhodococcus ruber]|nr:transglycosylase domain-containing protein [Rhodococcus ruber]